MLTIDVKSYADRTNTTPTTIYRQIGKNLLKMVMVDGIKHIVIEDKDKIEELMGLEKNESGTLKEPFNNIDEDSESFKLIKKGFKEIVRGYNAQIQSSEKTIATLEQQISVLQKQIESKDKMIESLSVKHDEMTNEMLDKVLKESQETKDVYSKLVTLLLPDKERPGIVNT